MYMQMQALPPRLIPNAKLDHKNNSILEIIIHSRALTLRHTLLLPVHLRHLPRARRHIRFLVISDLDESRKAETNPLLPIYTFLTTRLIPRTQRQIRRLDLPNILRFEPDIRLVLVAAGMGIERLWTVDDD
jgi:hypothetical protein